MDTELHASVATFRVYTSGQQRSLSAPRPAGARVQTPPTRAERMAATPVTEGPLILSRLATNEMSYLQVHNFTRAIMPRSHIWRVSDTELVVPASFTNYWLITLSGSRQAILKLDQILRFLCKYEVLGEDDADEEAAEENEPAQSLAVFEDHTGASAPVSPNTLKVPRIRESRCAENTAAASAPLSTHEVFSQQHIRSSQSSPPKGHAYNPDTMVLVSPPTSPLSSPSTANEPACTGHGLDRREGKSKRLSTRQAKPRVRLITPPEMDNYKTIETPSNPPSLTSPATSLVATPPAQSASPSPGLKESSVTMPLADAGRRSPSPEPSEDSVVPLRNHFTLQKSLDSRFGPRFSHPLIPSSHIDHTYPSTAVYPTIPPRLALQRRELLAVGPNSLHQDVTTVGGYIGLKAVNRIFRKT